MFLLDMVNRGFNRGITMNTSGYVWKAELDSETSQYLDGDAAIDSEAVAVAVVYMQEGYGARLHVLRLEERIAEVYTDEQGAITVEWTKADGVYTYHVPSYKQLAACWLESRQ
jgi:hypothetical protein